MAGDGDASTTMIRQLRETLAENVSGELDKVKQELQDDLEHNNETLKGAIEGLLAGLRDEVLDTIKETTQASAKSLETIQARDTDLYQRIDAALSQQQDGGGGGDSGVGDELHKLNEMFAILFGLAEKALTAAADNSSGAAQGSSSGDIRKLSDEIKDLRRAVESRGGATGVAVTGDSSAVSRQLSDLSAQISRLSDKSFSGSGAGATLPSSSSPNLSGHMNGLREDVGRLLTNSQRQLDADTVRNIVDRAKQELLSAMAEHRSAEEATPSGPQSDERLIDAKVRAAVRDVQRELEAAQVENAQLKGQMERSRGQAESHWESLREERQSLEFQKSEFSALRRKVMDEIETERAKIGATPRDQINSSMEREKQIVIETRKRLEAERQIVDYERKRIEERSRDYDTNRMLDQERKQYNNEVKRLIQDLQKQSEAAERNKIELEDALRQIGTQSKQMQLMKHRLAIQRDQLAQELGRSSAGLAHANGDWGMQRSGLEKKLAQMGRKVAFLSAENTRLRGETPKNFGDPNSSTNGTPVYGAQAYQAGAYVTTPGI